MNNRRGKSKTLLRYAADEMSPETVELLKFGRKFPVSPGLAIAASPLGPSAVRLLMSYSTTVNMTSTVGALATYIMTGNGLFDPDVTGSGLQPLGFDQWATLYQRYRVIASNIQVSFSTPGATTNATGSFDVALTPSNTSSVYSTFTAAASAPFSKYRTFNGNGSQGITLKSKMDTSTVAGVTHAAVLAEDILQASVSANPSDMWFWHICAQTVDLSTTGTVYLVIKVTYLVDFFALQVITLSSAEAALARQSVRDLYLQAKRLRRASLKIKSSSTPHHCFKESVESFD
jgi:hypothetical protein